MTINLSLLKKNLRIDANKILYRNIKITKLNMTELE